PPRRIARDPDHRRRGGAPVARHRKRARAWQEVRALARRSATATHRRKARALSTDRQAGTGAWTVVWATFVCLAVIFGVAYSFAAFFRSFATEFAVDRADVSLVFGLSGLLYFLLGAPAGMLADRFGPRLVCTAGMLCIAAGLLASSVAPSMPWIYAAWGAGLGIGLAYAPSIASVPPWFVERRAFAAGIASTGIGVGTLALPLVATATIDAV